jgi:hypothetical protein
VGSFSVEILKVPEVVVGRLSLRYLVMRFWLACMDEVWELDGVLDEEDWDIVSDDVPVSFGGIMFNCEATDVADLEEKDGRSVASLTPQGEGLRAGETCWQFTCVPSTLRFTYSVATASTAEDCREAHKGGCGSRGVRKHTS